MTIQFRKRDAERTKHLLLSAAAEVFIDRGFDAARVDEIAKRAGVNKRLIYLYFGNKEDIYREVLKERLNHFMDTSRQYMDTDQPPKEQAAGLLRHFFYYLADNPGFVRLLAWESLQRKRSDQSDLVPLIRAGLLDLSGCLQRGIEQGVFRADLNPKQLLLSVVGLCLTYFQRRLLMSALWNMDVEDPQQQEEAFRHVLTLIFNGILAQPTGQSEESR